MEKRVVETSRGEVVGNTGVMAEVERGPKNYMLRVRINGVLAATIYNRDPEVLRAAVRQLNEVAELLPS